MSGILRLESLTKGNTLKQGDKTPLKYRLFDADGEKLNIAGKTAKVRLVYPDFLTIGYEKDGLTVAQDDTVTFTIDGVIPSRIYHVEIIVDGQFIFPSRSDESKFTVDKSSLGTEANIIEIVGVDTVVRKAVDLINEDPSLIIDEDKLVGDIISNTGIGNINEYYQAFNDLKPKAEQSISRSLEALSKSQNALNVANGIDAKATNALSLSESADTLSKSVQEQFNQVVIDGDSSVEAAQARVGVDGVARDTLKERLDYEHSQLKKQFEGNEINAMFPPPPFVGVTPDANYYNPVNFKYYQDSEMTLPATDNTPTVQALVDFISTRGGGRLFLPRGNYVFRSTINWKSKVSLRGSSKLSTKLYAEGELFSLIQGTVGSSTGGDYASDDVWFEDCEFTDFLIDNKGLSHTEPSVSGKAIFILYMKRALFRDLILVNTIGTALGCDFLVDTLIENVFTDNAGRNSVYTGGYGGNSGIGIGTSALSQEPVVVSNCFTYNSGNYGVFVETQANPAGFQAKYAKIINCHAQGNKLGFGNKGSGGTQFIGCTAVENRVHGFHLTQGVSGDQIIACIAENNVKDGIRIEQTYLGDLDISNTKIDNNGDAGIRSMPSLSTLNKVRINNVKVHKNGSSGIWMSGNIKDLSISNVSAVENGQSATMNLKFKRGILIEGINDIVSITNNIVYDDQETKTQLGGIDVSAQTNNLLLDGNNLIGYSQKEGYQIRTSGVTYGANRGLNQEAMGQITFPDGVSAVYVNHYLGTPAKSIVLTPLGDYRVWVIQNTENNRIRIQRDNSSGALEVMYRITI